MKFGDNSLGLLSVWFHLLCMPFICHETFMNIWKYEYIKYTFIYSVVMYLSQITIQNCQHSNRKIIMTL